MTALVRTRPELTVALAGVPGRVGLVMTMGALHDGHAALLRAARERSDFVVATIFVNPLQFGPDEDLDRYPRTLEADLEICRAAGVDLVYAPAADEVYPEGAPLVRVDPGPLGTQLEGASRPGFFHGVLTVVLKMFHVVGPAHAFFGEKDYQQLALVRRMVRDLDLAGELEIVGVPTVREADGLALSSRNRYLDDAQRRCAATLSAALRAGSGAAARGLGPAAVLAAAHRVFDPGSVENPRLDYLVLTDPDLRPDPVSGEARLLVAAWVGGTRLIDNTALHLTPAPA